VIAHECGHLVRLWTVGPAARRLTVSDRVLQVGAIEQLDQELADMVNAGMPPAALSRMFGLMCPGAVRQVTNVAIDIRIERWLHGQHPALREAQRASLTAQTRENAQVLDPQIARITPPTIYRASTAIGSAFARAVADLYGEPALAASYRATDVWDLGGELLDTVAHAHDDADGDVALVDRWAERLGLRDWYRWEQLDTLPPTEATVSSGGEGTIIHAPAVSCIQARIGWRHHLKSARCAAARHTPTIRSKRRYRPMRSDQTRACARPLGAANARSNVGAPA